MARHFFSFREIHLSFCLIGITNALSAAEVPKAPVPKSPYLPFVYRYADTMLKNGRATNGLFHSALDRNALAPLTNRPAPPSGVRASDRVGPQDGPLVGSNPYHDENLLRLLSTLTDLSAKPHYRAAADVELKWFVESNELSAGESFRPWMLWDRCFEVAPMASEQSMLRRLQQIKTRAVDSPRKAGFNIRALAVAHARTRDERFALATTGWLERFATNADFTPSLAIDCDGAAHRLPEPMASRLRTIASRQDELFLSLGHDLKKGGGFISDRKDRRTLLWQAGRDTPTTAQIGMMCMSRYDNTGNVRYRDLILAAADAYLDSLPADGDDAWPATFGHAISLELAAWRHSADWKYMERARKLGDVAVEKFWGTNALPRASLKTDHYESITGADTLALALLELHLQVLHITAVRCPPNTIDR
ncbi:MAG TPA: hypothetical protein VGF13_02100 [Verrucomicrobiae bacterium]